MGENVPPPGVIPLFLTGTTQEIFHIKADEDVTAAEPIKMVSKADILADVQFRGAISDFHPAKEGIVKYKGDEIFVVLDDDSIFGENFYICVTEEAIAEMKGRIEAAKAKPADEGEGAEGEGGAPGEKKPPRPEKWISLGSELEIDEQTVHYNRSLLNVNISRKRREFNSTFKFIDRDAADDLNDFRPYKDPNFELRRIEKSIAVQAVNSKVNRDTQTPWFRTLNGIVQYEPIQMDEPQKETHLLSSAMSDFLSAAATSCDASLLMNETVNVFDDDYDNLAEEDSALGHRSDNVLRELQSFTDLEYSKNKRLSCIDWQPGSRTVVGVSCVERMDMDKRIDNSRRVTFSYILIWNFADPIHPQLVLQADAEITCFKFNPTKTGLIAAGTMNGQVLLYDTTEAMEKLRQKKSAGSSGGSAGENSAGSSAVDIPMVRPILSSSLENGHKREVTDLQWVPVLSQIDVKGNVVGMSLTAQAAARRAEKQSGDDLAAAEQQQPQLGGGNVKQTEQLVTVAPDGSTLFWDMQYVDTKRFDNTWVPFFAAPLARFTGGAEFYAPTSLSLTGKNSTEFAVGTEDGHVLRCNWEGGGVQTLSQQDDENAIRHVKSEHRSHFAPVTSCCRSALLPDVLACCGDWSFTLWNDAHGEGPIFESPYSSSRLSAVRWSPSRHAILLCGRADGALDVWDMLDRTNEPSMSQTVTTAVITALEFCQVARGHGHLLAVADDMGTLHILEVPRNLSKPGNTEEKLMQGYLQREIGRVAHFESRQTIRNAEFMVKERMRAEQDLARQEAAERENNASDAADAEEEARIEQEESQYREMELAFKQQLGIVPPARDAPEK